MLRIWTQCLSKTTSINKSFTLRSARWTASSKMFLGSGIHYLKYDDYPASDSLHTWDNGPLDHRRGSVLSIAMMTDCGLQPIQLSLVQTGTLKVWHDMLRTQWICHVNGIADTTAVQTLLKNLGVQQLWREVVWGMRGFRVWISNCCRHKPNRVHQVLILSDWRCTVGSGNNSSTECLAWSKYFIAVLDTGLCSQACCSFSTVY